MGYIWEFNTHGDVFTYNDITVKASELCWRDDNGKINTVKDGKIPLAYMDENNIIRDKDGGDKVVAPRSIKIGKEFKIVKDNFNGELGIYYLVNTTDKAVKVTLPKDPEDNFIMYFMDLKSNWDVNNLILSRDNADHYIMGEKADRNINIKNYSFGLLFVDNDWRIL